MLPSGNEASASSTRLVPPCAMTAIRRPAWRSTTLRKAGGARPEIGQALAVRERHREWIGEPAVAKLRLPRRISADRETLPASHGHLAKRRHGHHAGPPGGGKRRRRLLGAKEVARVDGLDRLRAEALPERRLGQARRRQGDVHVPEEAAFRGMEDLAVAGEVHPGRRHQVSSRKSRLTASVRTLASVVSTVPPACHR